MDFQVYRANASSYQDSRFLSKEKRVLEEISGVKYIQSLQEAKKDRPFILITNTHTQLEQIAKPILEKTQLIVHPNSGYDNFNNSIIKESSIPITIGNPIRANAVAEYTLSTIFNHFCQIPNHHHWLSNRTWKRKLLRDQKVVILGYGHIGKILYNTLKHLCREVIVFDHFIEQDINPNIKSNFTPKEFQRTDILIVAANLNPTSYKYINKAIFDELNKSCLIINPARGEIVDENDLISFLKQNTQSFAYLDVFEKEPFAPGHMGELKNLNKTSHIAGVYEKLNSDIISFEYIVIKDYIEAIKNNNISKFEHEYAECLLTNKSEYNESSILR